MHHGLLHGNCAWGLRFDGLGAWGDGFRREGFLDRHGAGRLD
jgi:hypothetical protein